MTEKIATALDAAWQERGIKWREGSDMIEKGNLAWKEIASLPGALRVGMWFGVSEASYEAAKLVADGYKLRMDSDLIWHDALIADKGASAKISWEYVADKKAYRCILPTGEIFEP
jgi:hypothetical protein